MHFFKEFSIPAHTWKNYVYLYLKKKKKKVKSCIFDNFIDWENSWLTKLFTSAGDTALPGKKLVHIPHED